MIEAVFLDAGDTLFCIRTSREAVYCAVAGRHGLHVEQAALGRVMNHIHDTLPQLVNGHYRYSLPWFRHYIETVFAATGHPGPPPALVDDLFAAFEDPETYRLYPEVVNTLTALRERGLTLGVVSNWSPVLPGLLGRLGIAPFFSFVLDSASLRAEKPEARIFEIALERSGVSPAQAIHVGDRPDLDVAGAEGAGVRGVLIDRNDRFPHHHGPRIRALDPSLIP